jgi:hypothetical protein
VDGPDGQHRRLGGRALAGHQGLQGAPDLEADRHRVDREVGPGGVPALAGDGEHEAVGRRRDRSRLGCELADGEGVGQVEADGRVHPGVGQGPFLDHQGGAPGGLLGRLEGEDDVPRQTRPAPGEHPGGRDRHGGVAVVSAGVHRPRDERAVLPPGDLLHRQGVHVRPDEQRAARRPGAGSLGPLAPLGPLPAQDAQDARAGQSGAHLEPRFAEQGGDALRRAVLLEGQLGVAVQVAAQPDDEVAVLG